MILPEYPPLNSLQIMKNNKKFILSGLLILLITGLSAFKIYDDGDDFEIAKSLDLFHDVVREVRLYYVDDVDIPKLIGEATKEFLKKLDPYTVFYSENEIEDFTLMTTGAYGGVGAAIIKTENSLLISDIRKGYPADSSGLKTGDEIIAINNINVTKENISEIIKNLKGEPGSTVTLQIKRYGQSNVFKKTIVRKKIISQAISYADILSGNTAYIKLNEFRRSAASDFKRKLIMLDEKQKLSGLIIDLRGNPGGLLNEAVEIVNLFVPKGSKIVSTKGKVKSWNYDYIAQKEPDFPDLPVTVLINNRSASASEIVAGALQDLDRAVIIGQRSFGKGLVQITRKVEYNTRIKITTAKYYIPSGRCIQIVDYSHRNPDGSVGKVPDSLISEFKTKNGRKVFDGGGVKPDIIVKPDSLNKFTKDLINNYEIFDFCTEYYFKNKTISKPENFSLSNSDYQNFITFVLKSKTEFQSEAGKIAKKLAEVAEKEHYDKNVTDKITDLQKNLAINKEEALLQFKKEIIPILEREIIKRYYYEAGVLKRETVNDKLIKTAKEILRNKEKYQKILSGINE